jgi:hypothetical protein
MLSGHDLAADGHHEHPANYQRHAAAGLIECLGTAATDKRVDYAINDEPVLPNRHQSVDND